MPRVLQCVPALSLGGVERGTVEVDCALGSSSSWVASAGGTLTQQLCGRHLQSPSLKWRNPLAVLLLNPLLLLCWARRHRIHLIHARSRAIAISALVVRLLMPRLCVVITWHGLYSSGSWWRRALNGLLLRADRLILPSRTVARHLQRQYPGARQAAWRVVWRGVEAGVWGPFPCEAAEGAAESAAAETARAAASERVVLCVGRVSRTKGQDLLLEALHTLGRPVRAVLLGDCGGAAASEDGAAMDGARRPLWRSLELWWRTRRGAYRSARQAAAARGTAHGVSVSILPHGDTACVAAHFAAVDVVVVPSRRPEAFGRVLVEALAAGRVVVTFHHGAAGELAAALWEHAACRDAAVLLSPGVLLLGAVLLVAPGDTRGLAAAIGAALDMPATERRRRTRAAQAAVLTQMSLQAFVEGTFAVCAECS